MHSTRRHYHSSNPRINQVFNSPGSAAWETIGDRAAKILRLLNPIERARDPEFGLALRG
jgi:hypothetical protein